MIARGLKIGNKHTSANWGLILTGQSIGFPEPKTNYIDRPSGDGSIDLTEALTGEVHFDDRKGSFEFDVTQHWKEWPALLSEIGAFLHGRKHKIILPDDPDHYYFGRLTINSFKTNRTLGVLSIETLCEPWKYKVNPTVYQSIIGATGRVELNCTNTKRAIVPTLTVSAEVNIVFGNGSYSIGAGTKKVTNIVLTEGDNKLVITGSPGTTIKIEYQEGAI